MAEHLIVTDTDGNGKYSQAELETMTKDQIIELATQLGYVLTVTNANKKDEIIADFLAKQPA